MIAVEARLLYTVPLKFDPHSNCDWLIACTSDASAQRFSAQVVDLEILGLTPHRLLVTTSPLDDENQVPTSKETRRRPPLVKHRNRRPGSHER